jgi:hypothetical protein
MFGESVMGRWRRWESTIHWIRHRDQQLTVSENFYDLALELAKPAPRTRSGATTRGRSHADGPGLTGYD